MSVVVDLDILRPEQKFIRLNGKDFDVSFIPCGVTFEIENLLSVLGKIPETKILKGGKECKEAFELSIKICSCFVTHLVPEMDAEWFRKNVDAVQINSFVKEIQTALMASYKGVADYGKK